MMKFQMVQCYSVPTGKVFLMRSPSLGSLTSIEVADINDQSAKSRREIIDRKATFEMPLFLNQR